MPVLVHPKGDSWFRKLCSLKASQVLPYQNVFMDLVLCSVCPVMLVDAGLWHNGWVDDEKT